LSASRKTRSGLEGFPKNRTRKTHGIKEDTAAGRKEGKTMNVKP
jgi:hypothetical protein